MPIMLTDIIRIRCVRMKRPATVTILMTPMIMTLPTS